MGTCLRRKEQDVYNFDIPQIHLILTLIYVYFFSCRWSTRVPKSGSINLDGLKSRIYFVVSFIDKSISRYLRLWVIFDHQGKWYWLRYLTITILYLGHRVGIKILHFATHLRRQYRCCKFLCYLYPLNVIIHRFVLLIVMLVDLRNDQSISRSYMVWKS